MLMDFVDATNDANHYTKPPPNICKSNKAAPVLGLLRNTQRVWLKLWSYIANMFTSHIIVLHIWDPAAIFFIKMDFVTSCIYTLCYMKTWQSTC